MAGELAALEAIAATIRASGTPFMPELARRFYPATLRLRELLATTLGRPRLILGQDRLFGFDRYGQPGPTTQMAPAPLLIDPGSYLLDWCRCIFQGEPRAVRGFGGVVLPEAGQADDFESIWLEFPGGAGADRRRPLPPPDLGRGRCGSSPRRDSRSTPSAGRPGWSCPTASSGPTPTARTRSGSPWSRPSARCSTTSSTGWSAAPSPWPRRSTTPWPSRA